MIFLSPDPSLLGKASQTGVNLRCDHLEFVDTRPVARLNGHTLHHACQVACQPISPVSIDPLPKPFFQQAAPIGSIEPQLRQAQVQRKAADGRCRMDAGFKRCIANVSARQTTTANDGARECYAGGLFADDDWVRRRRAPRRSARRGQGTRVGFIPARPRRACREGRPRLSPEQRREPSRSPKPIIFRRNFSTPFSASFATPAWFTAGKDPAAAICWRALLAISNSARSFAPWMVRWLDRVR
jgi:hypothetical protein